MYLVKTPWLLKKAYPGLVWDTNHTNRCIYLTFDDGPIPIVTPYVLNILKQYNAKATFFCIGDNVDKYPEIFKQTISDGHAIGNHTYNHLKGWKTDTKTYVENFLSTDKILNTPLFRPPYGRIKKDQIAALKIVRPDIKIIMWNVLSGDFDVKLKPEDCLKNVLKYVKPGSIIVFHDSLKAFERLEYVLPKAMEIWKNKGYSFSSLAQL